MPNLRREHFALLGRRLSRAFVRGALLALALSGPALAQDIDWGGQLGVDSRSFFSSGADPQQDEIWHPSIKVEGDLSWTSEDRRSHVEINAFGRLEAEDEERSHFDIREAYYEYASDDGWLLLIGLAKEFWGVAESRHLVDVINQADALEDIDEEDRLGQPMIKLQLQKDWGDLEFFILPGFRERSFAGPSGRLRLPLSIDDDSSRFESSKGREHVDLAARYSHFIGAFDFGVSAFHGTSREPRFAGTGVGTLTPIYDQMTQLSLDAQFTQDAWLWKLEALWRDHKKGSFGAAVAGVEYSFFQVFESPADLGVIVEYQFDDRDVGDTNGLLMAGAETNAPLTIADDDVFAGVRLALNDTQSTTLLLGSSVDVNSGASLTIAEAERRIGQNWTIEIEARLFNGKDKDPIGLFERDDYLSIGLSRHF